MKFSKTLTALATAATLVAGVAIAQTEAPQPSPNTTGQPGSSLGATNGSMPNGGTMNNSGTMGSTVDSSASGTTNAQTDIVSPEPRADRN